MSITEALQPITVACPDCDLINQIPALAAGESANCVRCEATLSRNPPNAINRGIALTFTAIMLYAITCTLPFLSFGKAGIVAHTKLFSGIIGLYEQGMYFLAGVVSFTTVVVPVFMMSGLCYLLLPLRCDVRLPGATRVLRWILNLQPWNMVEIFMIGIIVAGVKLQKMAALEPGLGAWAFMLLIFVMAAIGASIEPRVLWERLESARCL
ncbi:MAG: paraquat-inducible protein A [Gammaproteobacteria bacterium]|nr:MAG: paraquat-inducible protein A [Gammaproteobacteria bacterium]